MRRDEGDGRQELQASEVHIAIAAQRIASRALRHVLGGYGQPPSPRLIWNGRGRQLEAANRLWFLAGSIVVWTTNAVWFHIPGAPP